MEMANNKYMFLLLLIVVGIQINSALYCYTCTSMEKAVCGDDFRINSGDANSQSMCDGSCVKRRGERVTGSVRRIEVVRSCILRRAEACYKEVFNNLEMYSCSCNGDFCNTSSRVSYTASLLFTMALSVVYYSIML